MLSKLKVWQSQPDAMDRLEGVGCCRHTLLPAGPQLASEASLQSWTGHAAEDGSMATIDAAVMLLELVSLLQMGAARLHQTASSPAAASSSLMGRMRTNTCRKGTGLSMECRLASDMSQAVRRALGCQCGRYNAELRHSSHPGCAATLPPAACDRVQLRTGHDCDCSCQGQSHLHVVSCPLSPLGCCSCQQAPLKGGCQGLGSAPLAGAATLGGAW